MINTRSNNPKLGSLIFSLARKVKNRLGDAKLTVASIGLQFDEEYYLFNNPDVRKADVDPVEHYLRYGWREGRNPRPDFDTNFYLRQHMASLGKNYCPLVHYIEEGERLGLATESTTFQSALFRGQPEVSVGFIEHLSNVQTLQHSVFASEENRRILCRMFSPSFYRRRKKTNNISDGEAFKNYLIFDLDSGMEPGPLFVNEYYSRVVTSKGFCTISGSLFLHWLEHGLQNRISPNPVYSFDEYLELNPDVAIFSASAKLTFLHFLEYGLSEGRRISMHIFPKIYTTLKRSEEQQPSLLYFMELLAEKNSAYTALENIDNFRKSSFFDELISSAIEIDPAIGAIQRNTPSIIPPWHEISFRDFQEILDLVPGEIYDAIIFMPFCKMGGADFVGGCLTHALAGMGRVLILRTDQAEWACPHWFPDDVSTIDLSSHLSIFDDRTRTQVLYEIIRKLRPKAVFNVNSRICFDTYVRFGGRISLFANIYAYYFCADRTLEGVEVGYPVRYFGQIIEHLKGAFIDNTSLATTLVERFLLPEKISGKVKVAYTPMMSVVRCELVAEKQVESTGCRENPVLLWAGRFDRQKRFDLLLEIAKRLPDVTFKCWGKAVLDAPPDLTQLPSNVEVLPPFKSPNELPLSDSDGWIYTSEWDGLPTILIECGGLGLPIVASDVGGVGELINEDTGWPVQDWKSVQAYVEAINHMLANPDERVRRARNLKQTVLTRHTMENYKETIKSVVGTAQDWEKARC